ncbi:hypothetical protein [Paraburkholderia sp. BCC1876]|jgi:hypothetical protein|uniref:hypothetical protein n=1 Tax=Paraburkholderia sp. BCC1876 TaxID=2676303 RepID=UPI001590606D|nr:hypothetical protein [Paraburkholderia sp. BCC1876]
MDSSSALSTEALAKSSRQAAFLSAIGFVLIGVAIALCIYGLYVLEGKVRLAEAQLRTLQSTSIQLTADIAGERAEYVRLQSVLDRARLQLGTGDTDAAGKTLAAPIAVNGAETVAPRVYIQIRSDTQRPLYERLAGVFRESHIVVPAPELLEKGPNETEVRYFRKVDEKVAGELADTVRKITDGIVQVRYVSGYEDSPLVKPHQLELWLGPKA